ncbi:MAG: two-component regulator propeller domain-containing protein [Bacteroidota bacterium]
MKHSYSLVSFGKYVLLILLLFLGISGTMAQHPLWDNHLYTRGVTGIKQQGNSYWLATDGGGLLKYTPSTGSTVYFNKHNSAIPSVFLSVITIDSIGNKWVGTVDGTTGLICFNGLNTWTTYNTSNSPLPSNIIQSICYKNGLLWVGTPLGLARFDGTSWTIFQIAITPFNSYFIANVLDIAVDDTNNVWICSRGAGLMKYDGTGWTVYTNSNSAIHSGTYDNVRAVAIDIYGFVWVACDMGVSRLNGTTWAYKQFVVAPPGGVKMLMEVYGLKADTLGNVWMCIWGNEVIKTNWVTWQDLYNGITAPYIVPVLGSFFNSSYDNIYVDASNHVWVGMTAGLAEYDTSWTDHSAAIQSDLRSNGISVLNYIPAKNKLAIAESVFPSILRWEEPKYTQVSLMGSGLTTFDVSGWKQYDVFDTSCFSKKSQIYSLYSNPNNVWIGITMGLYRFDGFNFTRHWWDGPCSPPSPQTAEKTTALGFGMNGVFAGTSLGQVYKFNGMSWSLYGMAPMNDPPGTPINCIGFTDSTMLLGSRLGLFVGDSSNNIIYNTTNSGLPCDTINDILVDNVFHCIWIATRQGLTRTDLFVWTTYNTLNAGLPENNITCISRDSLGNLWLGTKTKGLLKFSAGLFSTFNTSNSGLTDNRITDIVVDNYNSIWVGTAGGGLCTYKYGVWLSDNPVLQPPLNNGLSQMSIIPNPIKENATINVSMAHSGMTSLFIYNTMGQLVKTLLEKKQCHLQFSISWDGTNDRGMALPPGIYFCKLQTSLDEITKRIILIK